MIILTIREQYGHREQMLMLTNLGAKREGEEEGREWEVEEELIESVIE